MSTFNLSHTEAALSEQPSDEFALSEPKQKRTKQPPNDNDTSSPKNLDLFMSTMSPSSIPPCVFVTDPNDGRDAKLTSGDIDDIIAIHLEMETSIASAITNQQLANAHKKHDGSHRSVPLQDVFLVIDFKSRLPIVFDIIKSIHVANMERFAACPGLQMADFDCATFGLEGVILKFPFNLKVILQDDFVADEHVSKDTIMCLHAKMEPLMKEQFAAMIINKPPRVMAIQGNDFLSYNLVGLPTKVIQDLDKNFAAFSPYETNHPVDVDHLIKCLPPGMQIYQENWSKICKNGSLMTLLKAINFDGLFKKTRIGNDDVNQFQPFAFGAMCLKDLTGSNNLTDPKKPIFLGNNLRVILNAFHGLRLNNFDRLLSDYDWENAFYSPEQFSALLKKTHAKVILVAKTLGCDFTFFQSEYWTQALDSFPDGLCLIDDLSKREIMTMVCEMAVFLAFVFNVDEDGVRHPVYTEECVMYKDCKVLFIKSGVPMMPIFDALVYMALLGGLFLYNSFADLADHLFGIKSTDADKKNFDLLLRSNYILSDLVQEMCHATDDEEKLNIKAKATARLAELRSRIHFIDSLRTAGPGGDHE